MTTLITDQIKHIEETLITQYNIKYQDTRDEVLDHIACEIEELMNEGAYFHEASKITIAKWNSQLKPSNWVINKTPRFIVSPLIVKDMQSIGLLFVLAVFTTSIIHVFIKDQLFILGLALAITAFPMLVMGYLKYKKNRYANFKQDYYTEHIKGVAWFSLFVLDGMVALYYSFTSTFSIVYLNLIFLLLAIFLSSIAMYLTLKHNQEYNSVSSKIL
ncbi:hypothetical protein HX045_08015 [Myroides odoratimimus]|uniref:Uncharacterized protein n=1 Tax=Myroides odoratimimus TaxID=76832 RepID=A0A0S7EK36_9FLAO|nr:hypothetical protein [Myroides odoratimimus]ALU27572.1 hypothetical protein AS202_16100 [Myroides odoratimimus]MCA4793510.1 hypothetical protein [Myroides odoratimimus]MCA4820747.1 hypothetical protein [Myroides odoratimimus]MCO7722650.1 hypothetical protein [Myroides odoratimimus]MDM1035234.1 hypothetical protein [Myroides odoratimimus]